MPLAAIADDFDDGRELLACALRAANFEVHECRDAFELLATLEFLQTQSKRVDVVVSDIGMPDMDGVELTQRLQEEMPTLPIVLVTGFSNPRILQAARAAGARAVLQRPLDPALLVTTIRSVLERH